MLFLIYLFMSVIIKVILKLRFEKILLFIFIIYLYYVLYNYENFFEK